MIDTSLKIAFFGTPHFAVYVLEEMKKTGLVPSVIVTAAEKPAGRGLLPRPAPVKMWGVKEGLSVVEPAKLDTTDTEAAILYQQSFDLFVVAGYGKILPHSLLSRTMHGVLNVHPSLLPKYRGPSPIESQILDDVRKVGVSVILLDEETDHGPIVAQKSFTPEPWPMMRGELEDLLWKEGGRLLAESLQPYIEGSLRPSPQNHAQATFTKKLKKDDGLLNLSDNPYANYLKYCAYERWPGTFFFSERNGKRSRIKIAKAEYEDGKFKILRVIPEGKKEMSYADFARNL